MTTLRTILTDLGLDTSRDLLIEGDRVMYRGKIIPGQGAELTDSGLTWAEVVDAIPALTHPRLSDPIRVTRDRDVISVHVPGQAIRAFDPKSLFCGGGIDPMLDLEVAS